jgi:hypothetical protein
MVIAAGFCLDIVTPAPHVIPTPVQGTVAGLFRFAVPVLLGLLLGL